MLLLASWILKMFPFQIRLAVRGHEGRSRRFEWFLSRPFKRRPRYQGDDHEETTPVHLCRWLFDVPRGPWRPRGQKPCAVSVVLSCSKVYVPGTKFFACVSIHNPLWVWRRSPTVHWRRCCLPKLLCVLKEILTKLLFQKSKEHFWSTNMFYNILFNLNVSKWPLFFLSIYFANDPQQRLRRNGRKLSKWLEDKLRK